tara:strand:+ start:76819 stop:77811 length:993 start_codon:yes stop_codon:yes gene_type:complete
MVFIFSVAVLISISSCGSQSKKKKVALKPGERPEWIFEPGKACKSYELCAVGEAAGSLGADVAARKNLAKIFETKVSSELNINTTSSSTVKEEVVTGRVDEDVQEKIREQTDQVLRGVQINEIFEGKDSFFALAVLNKKQAAKRIASEIEAVDTEMRAYLNDGRRSSLNKALKKYYLRNNLNERHQFLSGRRISSPVSLRTILNKKRKKRELGTTVKVKFSEVGGISEVNHLIISHLLENDFKVVTGDNRNSKFSILGSLKKEQQHMNVKGFKRYKFFLQLKSQNKNGEKIGALDFDTVQTGRNLQHAYENAMPEIRQFLDDKLGELNID